MSICEVRTEPFKNNTRETHQVFLIYLIECCGLLYQKQYLDPVAQRQTVSVSILHLMSLMIIIRVISVL